MHSAFTRSPAASHRKGARADKVAGIAVAVALHAVAIGVLLSYAPARTALINAVPLMVSLITPPAPEPRATPTPPKPLPMTPVHTPPPRALPLPAVITAQAEARATDTVVPSPTPAPPVPVEAVPAPAPVAAAPVPPPAPPAQPAPEPVFAPSFNAAYLNNPPPAYPRLARRQGHHGKVVLRVFVGAGGIAQSVEVRTTCGYEALDQAAVEAVRRWRFVPARQGDQPVAAWVLVPITFTFEY